MGKKKDPIIIYMEDFLLSLPVGVLLDNFKAALASQALKRVILQEAFLIAEPREVHTVPKLTKHFAAANAMPVGCKKILPQYRFL